jgi:cytoplasmic iron level regulating protein YaaA (DUF328/UPF0246 family)
VHILLPPSETKRDGGAEGSALDLAELGFSRLNSTRRTVLAAVRSLSTNRATAARALKLSRAQYFEVERNRALRRSAVMPAMDRYSGVLYDALDAGSLSVAARARAGTHVVIHSALFGLLRASDLIPAYRLSHDSRVPGISLGPTWRTAVAKELARLDGLVLDLRSESYVALGPAPNTAHFLRVVTEDERGARRALNHFNKKAKGEFVRELLETGSEVSDEQSLFDWARDRRITVERGAPGEFRLVI